MTGPTPLPRRKLGTQGLEASAQLLTPKSQFALLLQILILGCSPIGQVSALGLGCRSLSPNPLDEKPVDENHAQDVINFAYDNGVTFFDSSDFYGIEYSNEIFLGKVR